MPRSQQSQRRPTKGPTDRACQHMPRTNRDAGRQEDPRVAPAGTRSNHRPRSATGTCPHRAPRAQASHRRRHSVHTHLTDAAPWPSRAQASHRRRHSAHPHLTDATRAAFTRAAFTRALRSHARCVHRCQALRSHALRSHVLRSHALSRMSSSFHPSRRIRGSEEGPGDTGRGELPKLRRARMALSSKAEAASPLPRLALGRGALTVRLRPQGDLTAGCGRRRQVLAPGAMPSSAATAKSCTVTSPVVKVPVLPEQKTMAQPNVSTASIRSARRRRPARRSARRSAR